jgi:anti-sigma B factor antagonist
MPPPDSLFSTRRLDRGVTQVSPTGELDLGVAVVLRQSLDDLIRDGQVRLLVDLTDVTFLDSTALGVLLHTAKKLRRRRGGLAVVCPDPAMRNLFELVGHNLLFPVDESIDKAVSHLRPRRRLGQPSPQPHSGS